MFHIFLLIFTRNIRSIFVLFFVLMLSCTGFLVIRQLTENVELWVAQKTQPLFGADIRITNTLYTSWSLIEDISPYLTGITYSFGEKTEFSTTLLDSQNKARLVNVIAYSGVYPQKWLLTLKSLSREKLPNIPYIAATPGIIDQFASGNSLNIDNRIIHFSDIIIESSDLGFSFWQDNNLIILPKELLSGSLLMSSGSRLSNVLMLSIPDIDEQIQVYEQLKSIPALSQYQIRSYRERSEQTMDIVWELTNYIQLILVVAVIFAGIILRSSHERLFADLANTLRIVEILWLSRRRQAYIFLLIYFIIIPLSFVTWVILSRWITEAIRYLPWWSDIIFLFSPIVFSLGVFVILVLMAFLPHWINRIDIWFISSNIQKFLKSLSLDTLLNFIGIIIILWIIFQDIIFSVVLSIISIAIFLLFSWIFRKIYQYIQLYVLWFRKNSFFFFDGIRSLSRPLLPTIPITISLVGMSIVLFVFIIFSLSFRNKLYTDTQNSANVYAINILESDLPKINPILSESEIFSIIRARIVTINWKTLSDHLGQKNPTSEFTREFNITTNELDFPILEWTKILQPNEVSVDNDFAHRIGISLWDSVEFNLSWKSIYLKVANIRKSVREWFRPFFYFSFQKEAFKNAPKTYFVATYTPDIEWWKKIILQNSWSHVTFVDIENILKIVREVSAKILAVIGLFFGVIGLFFIFAIIALFGQMCELDSLKYRLYPLFGWLYKNIRHSLLVSRMGILSVSIIIAIWIWGLLVAYILLKSTFLESNSMTYILGIVGIFILYCILYFFIRPDKR